MQWRKARGLTQNELAAALGVSVRTIKGWEAGHVPAHRVEAVGAALRVEVGELERAPVEGPDQEVARLVEKHGERAVLAAFVRAMHG